MKIYNPVIHGSVRAVRLFTDCTPMAELAFASGVTETINWSDISERTKYAPGITAYTVFFDERTEAKFEDFVRTPSTVTQTHNDFYDDLRMEQLEQM